VVFPVINQERTSNILEALFDLPLGHIMLVT